MMQTWVVANQKGGVGKTTTAVTLAGLLAEQGSQVLMIDLDPHASLSQYFDIDPDHCQYSVFDIFDDQASFDELRDKAFHSTHIATMKLFNANVALATLDKKFGQQKGLGLRLAQFLKHIEQQFDYTIVDCPPVLGVLMINALAAADQLIIPVQTEFLAIKGLERMLQTTQMVYRRQTNAPDIVIVPTLFDRRTRASIDSLRHLRKEYTDILWRSVISIDTQFRDASQAHKAPSTFMCESRGVGEYKQLCRDIQKGTINRFVSIMEAV
jgi:chromosome partitioning protein